MPSRLHPALLSALARGETLLVPNQRIARALHTAYSAHQLAKDIPLWTTPTILPLESFLAACWQQTILYGLDNRALITPTQEATLWREIIAGDPETPHLQSTESLAELAARAWNLLHLYGGILHGVDRLAQFPPSTDSRAFTRWLRAFTRRLSRSRLITPAETPTALPPIATPVTLVDFDTLPPAIAQLFPTATHLQTSASTSTATLLTAPDDPSQLQSAALWLRHHLTENPHSQIAVVVPDLASRRSLIDRAFAPILQPESLPITAPPTAPLYEFSLGRALTDLPLTHAALDLLAWTLAPLPLERISALLLNPWFLPTTHALAEFDAQELRRTPLLRPELSLAHTLQLAERSPRRTLLNPLINQLRALATTAHATFLSERPGQSEPLRQPHATWSETFATTLIAAGWSSTIPQSSLEFQQIRRFHAALDELASLDAIPDVPYSTALEALTTLRRILAQTVFAPESRNAPIQIMGPLEVGGIPFDALWFLSADDVAWPAPPGLNPLLPWHLQRALGMPGSDRERDDAAARTLTRRIALSAAEVVFSYALRTEEGERRRSPLLAALELGAFNHPDPVSIPDPIPLELIEDDVTLPPLPNRPVPGGANVLKLQAACAFRAFAEIRLASTQPDSRDMGLDARERGSLVHAVMEAFWRDLPSQSALRGLTLPARDKLLTQSIDSAISRVRARPESSWDRAYLAIERRRLHQLIAPWLDQELKRSPFQVLPPEQKKQFQLGPITLDLRIDRIDLTPAGTVILDYKTGLASPKDWQGDRPDDPQLPLYAVLESDAGREIAAVAFALLRAGTGLSLKGYAVDPAILGLDRGPAMEAPTLPEQITLWRETLTTLAISYAAGENRVAPKIYPKTCEYCSQRILCRLDPTSLSETLVEEPESEEL
jgi:probable DNA repair protein